MKRPISFAAPVRAGLVLVTLVIAACGGGGGGGSGGGGVSGPSLTVSPASVRVTADPSTSSTPTANVDISVHNPSAGGTYVGASYTKSGIASLSFSASGTLATLTVTFKDPSVVGAGTYSDTVHVAVCTDSTCSKVQSGTDITISVTYTVALISTVTLSANPTTTGVGVPTTLTWSSTSAQSCTASGGWSGALPASGSKQVTPSTLGNHTYNLSCSNPGLAGQASVTVVAAPPVASLTAFPLTVAIGKPLTLRWQGQYAAGCVASGAWSGTLPSSGFRTISVASAGTLNFHVDCSNSAASAGADASATAVAAPLVPAATAYRMNEGHTGVLVTTNGIQYPATSAPSWTVDLGAPVSYPLIANGMVFVATAMPDGTYGNLLYGLNAQTGATVWGPVTIPGTYFGSGLSYDRGRVFVLMFDGAVRAFDASSGAALWTTQLPSYWYTGEPNAYGGILFLNGTGGLTALDEASGTVIWTVGHAGTSGWISPAVSSEGVYTQDALGCIAGAYDPVHGATLWETQNPCQWGLQATPVVKNGVLFGRTTSTLNLFDAATGTAIGQLTSTLAPAVTDTAFVAVTAGTLSSTRLSDFVQTWSFVGDGKLVTAPVVVNTTVFVGSSSGNVYGLDTATGAQVWTGLSPTPLSPDSENGGPMPPSGPAAGENLLIYIAGHALVAWQMQ